MKADVRRLTSLLRIQQLRAERNLPTMETSHHLVFTGNPGTGKTTVARLLSQILRTLGLVSKGHLVETDRSHLVAGYVGQTATKTRAVLESALGGTLLVDEAYALARGGDNDFGREAIDTIVKFMEDHRDDLALIAAGYPAEMEDFINANPGLKSRFTRFIDFPDYSTDELVEIFERMSGDLRYHLDETGRHALRVVIDAEPRTRGLRQRPLRPQPLRGSGGQASRPPRRGQRPDGRPADDPHRRRRRRHLALLGNVVRRPILHAADGEGTPVLANPPGGRDRCGRWRARSESRRRRRPRIRRLRRDRACRDAIGRVDGRQSTRSPSANRGAVSCKAPSARAALHETLRGANEGPLKDRLTDIAARLDSAIEESWTIAKRGDEIDEAINRIDPVRLRSQLETLRTSGAGDSGAAAIAVGREPTRRRRSSEGHCHQAPPTACGSPRPGSTSSSPAPPKSASAEPTRRRTSTTSTTSWSSWKDCAKPSPRRTRSPEGSEQPPLHPSVSCHRSVWRGTGRPETLR